LRSVSIIIAAHNEGDHVCWTIDSVLKNTRYPELDIVLVDDGSADASFAFLAREPYRRDGRLRQYRFETSVGCIRARHQGVLLASGDIIVFLDAHMAVQPGWLDTLISSLERLGPAAAITPNISPVMEDSWLPGERNDHVAGLDEKLDFIWFPEDQIPPTGLVSTVLGCCTVMPKSLYYDIGGFDLGLRRWGCEFIDLIIKVYAIGGGCYYEPAVTVGHLFRNVFPYAMSYRQLNYNKLRTGYVHFTESCFRRLVGFLVPSPEIVEAMLDFRADQAELDGRRAGQCNNHRDPAWFTRTFLPGLSG
jgi:glycosyltransferase involved in cell wall biosynthesis